MTGPAVCIAYRSLERPRGLARKGCPERVAARTDPLPNDYHVALGLVMPFLSQQDQGVLATVNKTCRDVFMEARPYAVVEVTLPTFTDSNFYEWIRTRHVDTLVAQRRKGMVDGAHTRDFLPGLSRLVHALESALHCPRRIHVHCDYLDCDVRELVPFLNRLIQLGPKEVVFHAPRRYGGPTGCSSQRLQTVIIDSTSSLEVLDIHLGFGFINIGGDVSGLKTLKTVNSQTAWHAIGPTDGFPSLEDLHLDGMVGEPLVRNAPCLRTISLGDASKSTLSSWQSAWPRKPIEFGDEPVPEVMARRQYLHLTLAKYMDPSLAVFIPATHLVLRSPADMAFDFCMHPLCASVEHIEMDMSLKDSDEYCFDHLARMPHLHTVRLVGVARIYTIDALMVDLEDLDICSLKRVEVKLAKSAATTEMYAKLEEMAGALRIDVVTLPLSVSDDDSDSDSSDDEDGESADVCIGLSMELSEKLLGD